MNQPLPDDEEIPFDRDGPKIHGPWYVWPPILRMEGFEVWEDYEAAFEEDGGVHADEVLRLWRPVRRDWIRIEDGWHLAGKWFLPVGCEEDQDTLAVAVWARRLPA